ncbi:MAG TPA: ATP-binding protein [Flavisolibacter sp.]|nr:ATP-binding protein [Flavisolibacter sp.]
MNLLKFILLLPACIFCTLIKAQDTTLNRLLALKDDTAKVNKLTKYAVTFTETNTAKAGDIFRAVMQVSEKINYPFGVGQAWIDIGSINAQQAKDQAAVANFKAAIPYFKKANRIDKVAACYLNIGVCAERYGDMQQTMEAVTQAVQLLEGTKHTSLLIHGYNSMAILFFNMDNFLKAQPYFEKALTIARNTKDTVVMVQSLFGLSNCGASLQAYSKAEGYSAEALQLAKASGKKSLLAEAHTSFAELYIKWKKGDAVIEHSEQVLKYASAINHTHYRLIAFLNLAEGHALKNDHTKRIQYLNAALAIAKENGTVIQLDDIYKSLAEGYEKTGDHRQALANLKQYIVNKDSTVNQKTNKAVAELEIKYQTAQKEKALSDKQLQIVQTNLQLEKSRQYIFYSIGAMVIALLAACLIYFNYTNRKKVHHRELKSMQQEKELQVLQAVLQGEEGERSRIAKDLHDGVAGMLAAVKMHFDSVSIQHSCVLDAEAYRQGVRLLDEASSEVRKTSHNLMPEVLLQYGLDEAIRRYCTNISNNDVLTVQYDSWGDIRRLKSSFELSVYRIVQELLNNIVKHSKANKAIVQVSAQNSILSVTVEDNGIGLMQAKGQAGGMGLATLRSRVEAIKGTIQIEGEAGNGVSAYLEFDTSGLEKTIVATKEKEGIIV